MELDLGPDPRTEHLRQIQNILIEKFGRIIRPVEKRRDPEWTLVQGVIGARTKTAVSNANADNLLTEYGSWEAVAQAPLGALEAALATATFPALMAERLKACLQTIVSERGAVTLRHLHNLPTEEAMAWLEALPGVARKISAGVVNASTLNRKALTIDTHHRRVVQRLGLVQDRADTKRAYDALMPIMPPEWSAEDVDEHHLLVKRLGQEICRPKNPKCSRCPLQKECPVGNQVN